MFMVCANVSYHESNLICSMKWLKRTDRHYLRYPYSVLRIRIRSNRPVPDPDPTNKRHKTKNKVKKIFFIIHFLNYNQQILNKKQKNCD